MLTFGSLFSGIGGLDLGLERSGMTCKWQVEIDDYATRVLERHWPDVRRWRDITTFPPDTDGYQLRNEPGRRGGACGAGSTQPADDGELGVDLICGGFPCQDISYAGRGAGLDGARSGLLFEAIRVVRQLRPRYVLLENVAALLSRGLDRVHGELAQIGYCSESHCIPAAAVGAPHIRDRVFVIGTRDSDAESIRCRAGRAGGTVGTGAGKENPQKLADAQDTEWWPDGGDPEEEGSEDGQQPRRAISGTPAISYWWAAEPDVGRVAHGVPSRVDRLRGLGNAVVPQVAEWIGSRIIKADLETE